MGGLAGENQRGKEGHVRSNGGQRFEGKGEVELNIRRKRSDK